MHFGIIFGLFVIQLASGKYLLVEVDELGYRNPSDPLDPKPCIGLGCPPCPNGCAPVPTTTPPPPVCSGPGDCCGPTCPKYKKVSITFEFSFRSSRAGPKCCAGLRCLGGACSKY